MSTEQSTFVTAEQLSKFVGIAKIYLLQRKEDYEALCKQFVLSNLDEGIGHKFENGYTAHVLINGNVILSNKDKVGGIPFETFEQFAAYWLARFW